MATFVLVHGGWSGAHSFRHIRRLLQAEGYAVFTPSLTGIGERSHLAHPMINLSTHARDVINHVLYEDLSDIVLVGFSYGGFVVTAALEHLSSRIAHLVYLDAFVPDAGETPMEHVLGIGRMPVEVEGAWTIPPVPREYDDAAEGEWMSQRRTPHPIGCFSDPVYLEQPLEAYAFTRTYIKATKNPESDMGAAALWRAADRAKTSPAWSYREIATTHMVANNKPEELAELLKEVISNG